MCFFLCATIADDTVPHSSSEGFVKALQRRNVEASLITLEGKTHTDPILEDPIRGNDELVTHMIQLVTGKYVDLKTEPMCSHTNIALAKLVNPF